LKVFKKKIFFLDRDGVIIKDIGHLDNIKKISFLPETFKTLKYIIKKKYKIIIITNQSVVGRGTISESYLKKIHIFIRHILSKKKIKILKIYYCPHHPEYGLGKYKRKCKCRKPKNYFLEKAIKKFKIDRKSSFFIGDKQTDKICAKKSKIEFLFRSKNNFYKQIFKKINLP
jgi:D-glycero-D-manno-heptose 1,7-bisphosphate phosphatase